MRNHFLTQNPCRSNPCAREGKLCQAGFTEKGFRCVCREMSEKGHCKGSYITNAMKINSLLIKRDLHLLSS